MKRDFSVEQCTYALFECPQDVNEITEKDTKAVSVEFFVIPLLLQNLLLCVTWRFDRWRMGLVHLFKKSQCILVYLSSTLHTEKTSR